MVHAEAYALWNGLCGAVSLLLGGKLAGLPMPRRGRMLLSFALSGVGALPFLLRPPFGILTIFLCPATVAICYGSQGIPSFFRALVTSLCAALLLGGATELLLRMGQSPCVAMSLSLLLALLLWVLAKLLPTAFCRVQQVEIIANGSSVILPAMVDSGNLLRDPITNLPVMVIAARAALVLFPDWPELSHLQDLPPGFRLLSVRTAAGRGLWPLFRPELCRVYVDGVAGEAQVMVAVAGRDYEGVQALVPLAAVPRSMAETFVPGAPQPAAQPFAVLSQK